jgi:hypothetical protein
MTWPVGFRPTAAQTTEEEATQIALRHAESTWGGTVAVGPALHEYGPDGAPFAFAVPVAVGRAGFPPVGVLLERVASLHRDAGMDPEGGSWATPAMVEKLEGEFGRFGTVYVSASHAHGPVLMTTNVLPPYFFMADMASAVVAREEDVEGSVDASLGRVLFASPHEERLECIAGDRVLWLDSESMRLSSEVAEGAEAAVAGDDGDVDEEVRNAWEAARAVVSPTRATEGGAGASGGDTVVTVPNPMRIPPVNWTYWCVPTAWTMAFAYWDHYTPGAGTHLGYGKVVDYWFDHDPTMHNVPNLIDEIIDKTKSPPTWAGDAFAIVNAQGYTFSKSAISCDKNNGWGFAAIKAEIDAGRPVLVGMMSRSGTNHNNHAMVLYGYRITSTGQRFWKLLNTWGTSWTQQSIELAVGIWQALPVIKMSAERLVPGGGTGADHLVLGFPGGGEKITAGFPYDVVWWVWGAATTTCRLSESRDGGRTWVTIADAVLSRTGKNTYRWVPPQAAARARIRVEGYTTSGQLVASDGSRHNVVITADPLNQWSGWLGLGRPGMGLSNASAARNADGRLEVLAVAENGSVWHRYQAAAGSTSWIGWGEMGTPPGNLGLREVHVATNADGRLDLIAVANNGTLWHRWQPQPSKGPWAPWSSLGKPTSANVRRCTTERNKDGRLQVFALGDDEKVWTTAQTVPGATAWDGWAGLGSPGPNVKVLNVAAATNTDGRIEIALSGGEPTSSEFGLKNPRVWIASQPLPNTSAPWSSWSDLGHPIGGTGIPIPKLARNADGRLELFAAGLAGQLWHRWQSGPGKGPWSAWASLGAPGTGEWLMSPLAVAMSGDGRLQAFGLGLRGAGQAMSQEIRHIWQTKPSNGWSAWGGLGSPPGRTVQWMWSTRRHDGRLELFALAAEDKTLWHIIQA